MRIQPPHSSPAGIGQPSEKDNLSGPRITASEANGNGALIAGKFRVVRELGRGGMGAVYEVMHEVTRHRRALKLLRRVDDAEHVQRLLREASTAGRVQSAHIVETLDAGVLEDGQAFILMELLEGSTLFDHLRASADVSLDGMVDLVIQACRGLHAAHEAGIVHRDVKPANLFVTTRDGKPFLKIVDFGVSKFDHVLTDETELTMDGALVGTPAYMAPEQIRAHKDVDRRADVYALGVVLYAASAGARPFRGSTLTDLAVAISEGAYVPLGEARPELPGPFVDVVTKAMAKDRADRYPSAAALADALTAACATDPTRHLEFTLPLDAKRLPAHGPAANGWSSPQTALMPPAPRRGTLTVSGPTIPASANSGGSHPEASAPVTASSSRLARWQLVVGVAAVLVLGALLVATRLGVGRSAGDARGGISGTGSHTPLDTNASSAARAVELADTAPVATPSTAPSDSAAAPTMAGRTQPQRGSMMRPPAPALVDSSARRTPPVTRSNPYE